MQKINQRLFLLSHFLLFSILILWFIPFTRILSQNIDIFTFQTLNSSLIDNPSLQTIIGILNHRYEARLNLVLAALLNILAILSTKDATLRKQRIKLTLYFWICFQIGFSLQKYIIDYFLHIERLSPSLVLPSLKLSQVLQDPNIKDFSRNSFLGGHAFAMIYWASFSFYCSGRKMAWLGAGFALLLCLPRLFSGAHWLTDEVFGAVLALLWLSWTLILLQRFRDNFE